MWFKLTTKTGSVTYRDHFHIRHGHFRNHLRHLTSRLKQSMNDEYHGCVDMVGTTTQDKKDSQRQITKSEQQILFGKLQSKEVQF